jgi:drug/metabolite transporter (DMT)-like permease
VATAYGILLFVTLIWGATFPVVQMALEDASPFAFVAVRFAVASLLFGLAFRKRMLTMTREQLLKGVTLGALLCGGYVLQTIGLGLTTAARSGFITGLLVPLTPVFAWLLFRDRISLRLWLAVLLAFTGLWIMSQPEAGGLNLGDVLTLVCAAIFALHVVFVSRWAKPENEIQLTGVQLATTSLIAFLTVPFEPAAHYHPTGQLIFITVFVAVFGSAFAITMQVKYQPRISPAAAAVIYACEPIFAGLTSHIILHHTPPAATLYGAACIVAGMVLSSLPSRARLTKA